MVPVGADGEGARGGLAAQHVISRSVRDSAAFLDAFAWSNPGRHFDSASRDGSYLSQVYRTPGKLRIAMMREPLQPTVVDRECVAAVEYAADLCKELGHEVIEAAPNIDTRALSRASGVLSVVSLANKIRLREAQIGRAVVESDIERGNWEMLRWGRQVPATDYMRSLEMIQRAEHEMTAFMAQYDLILSPTIARTPPKIGSVILSRPLEEFGPMAYRMAAFASLYNITGQPAMSVPLFWTEGNMPVGVMFAGRYGQDRMLYRIAAQLEKAKPWFARVPEI
ncbi:amidase [Marinobacterium halophilum]|nr:amidase family protein [Marinobacterium halophilum]